MRDNKIYLKIVSVVAIPTIAVLLLRSLVRGSAGNWIVSFLRHTFKFHPTEAQYIYQLIIRNNLDFILLGAIGVCSAILSLILVFYSQRQKMRTKEQLEQRKGELITYLAHDIKTPLTSIIGYLNLLSETPNMPTKQRAKHIAVALDKAYRLEEMVNQFFEITQYSLQTIGLSKKDIDLYYMLVQLTDEMYPLLESHNKTAVINAPQNLTLRADPDKLARAFNNILKNAAIYGVGNSAIDITASTKGDAVVVEFRNEGSIPRDKIQSIFDKFNRLDSAHFSNTGGAGLGLAIAKEIITMHKGQITADSINGYTTFAISLPKNPTK